jgi:hypothetical protein
VACAIGLAAGWLLVLILCAGQSTPALSASGGSGADAVQRRAWAETGDVSATWTSTQPVTTEVDNDPFVWPITQHGVTVTFYRNAVGGSAWFTFTPRSPSELPSGYLPTPYFFDLDGVYKDSGWPVSLDDTGIQIELKYDPSRLGEIENPRTLQFFHFGKTEWLPQGGDVDLAAKTLTLKTERTQSFAVGGDPPKQYVYLALVMRK